MNLLEVFAAEFMILVVLLLVQKVAAQDEVEVYAEAVCHLPDQVQSTI